MDIKIIDLFSGCGGMALGFKKAGFDIITGIENSKAAYETYIKNMYYKFNKVNTHIYGDIKKINITDINKYIENFKIGVIGGPPCQAYSLAGKGKLKSLGSERVNTKDERGTLYKEFLRIAYGIDAEFILIENVPEATNYGGQNIAEIISEDLNKHNYEVRWTILNAANFGVPQIRERLFILAFKKSSNKTVEFPAPTHFCPLDEYKAYYEKRINSFYECKYFLGNKKKSTQSKWITVKDAFSDLPRLMQNNKYRRIPNDVFMKYSTGIENEYQKNMRCWYNSTTEVISGNAFRNNTKEKFIFEKMKQGDNYLEAKKIATKEFEKVKKIYKLEEKSEKFLEFHNRIIPKYSDEKFVNKWKKLREDWPSHTVTAHLGKDTYSHIHPWEPRGISVREAARLQSFPDNFDFASNMGESYKMIGNAVPPLLSYNIAMKIKEILEIE